MSTPKRPGKWGSQRSGPALVSAIDRDGMGAASVNAILAARATMMRLAKCKEAGGELRNLYMRVAELLAEEHAQILITMGVRRG